MGDLVSRLSDGPYEALFCALVGDHPKSLSSCQCFHIVDGIHSAQPGTYYAAILPQVSCYKIMQDVYKQQY